MTKRLPGLLAAVSVMAQPVADTSVLKLPDGKLPGAVTYQKVSRAFLATQPGSIRARLHQSTPPNARFRSIDVAEWELSPGPPGRKRPHTAYSA